MGVYVHTAQLRFVGQCSRIKEIMLMMMINYESQVMNTPTTFHRWKNCANSVRRYRPIFHPDRERKCADTIGTVLVRWAGHFQC